MAKRQAKTGEVKDEIGRSIPLACADETVAVNFLEQLRWGKEKTHVCPHCNGSDIYPMMDRQQPDKRNRNFRWRCRSCGQYHTVRTGTVMEESLIPMRHWCYAFWKVCSSKKGVSSLQIRRETGLSYKSALFLMHRVRFALSDMPGCKLMEKVEVDETYVGGKPRKGCGKGKTGRGTKKQPVMVMVQRNGEARAKVIADVTANTLKGEIRKHVDSSAAIMTDEWRSYRGLEHEFAGGHHTVNHGCGEYSRGDVFTNTAESFFAIVKRGMYGTFHAVSKKHLHRYVNEFVFRWNTRKEEDGQRVAKAVRASEGKRLMYQQPASLLAS